MPITLNKAIEIQELNLKEAGPKMPRDIRDATILGVEALKKWKLLREGRLGPIDPLLPGEEPEPPCPN
jgi:hypothetical protein